MFNINQNKMKNYLFFAASIAMFGLTACQNDDIIGGEEGDATVSLTAKLDGGLSTRTTIYDTGKGTAADQCVLQVYEKQGENYVPYKEQVTAEVKNFQADFNDIRVVSGRTYKFVFWADNKEGDYYNDADLTNITMKEGKGNLLNDDKRDAFFGSYETTVTSSVNEGIELKRPFGQINLTTNDLAEVQEADKPNKVKVTYTTGGYTGLNALTGEVTGEQVKDKATVTADVMDAKSGYAVMDYLFTPEYDATSNKAETVVDFTTEFYKDNKLITTNSQTTNIPVRRNWRTNISGNLLTNGANYKVTINPGFDGELYALEYTKTNTEANMNNGGHWMVTSAKDNTVDLSKLNLANDLYLTVNTADQLTIKIGSTKKTEKNITVYVSEGVPTPKFVQGVEYNKGGYLTNFTVISRSAKPLTEQVNLNFLNVDNVTFSGLQFNMNNKDGYSAFGLLGTKIGNLTIENCKGTIVGNNNSFIKTDGNGNDGVKITGTLNILNNNVKVSGCLAELWWLNKSGVVNIKGNTVKNPDATTNANGVQVFECPAELNVENNNFEIGGNAVMVQQPSGNIGVRNNFFSSNSTIIFFMMYKKANTPKIEITGNTLDKKDNSFAIIAGGYKNYPNEKDSHAILIVKDNVKAGAVNSKGWLSTNLDEVIFNEGSDYESPYKN